MGANHNLRHKKQVSKSQKGIKSERKWLLFGFNKEFDQ